MRCVYCLDVCSILNKHCVLLSAAASPTTYLTYLSSALVLPGPCSFTWRNIHLPEHCVFHHLKYYSIIWDTCTGLANSRKEVRESHAFLECQLKARQATKKYLEWQRTPFESHPCSAIPKQWFGEAGDSLHCFSAPPAGSTPPSREPGRKIPAAQGRSLGFEKAAHAEGGGIRRPLMLTTALQRRNLVPSTGVGQTK